MKHLAAILCLILASCATPPPPTGGAITPPAKAKPVTPGAAKVRTQIGVVREQSVLVNQGLGNALRKVDVLVAQKAANEKDLKELWSILTEEKKRTAAVWAQLEATNVTVEELNNDAVAADAEIKMLRTSLDDANTRLTAAKKWQDSAAKKVAVYDWISSRLTWLLVAVIALALAYVALRIFKPAFLP